MVKFSGNVVDFSSGKPMGSQTIAITLNQNNCALCSMLNVATGNSDADGHFEFKKEMDTSLLENYHIEVQITTSDNYITRIAPDDSSVGNMYDRTRIFSFKNVDTSLNNILFKIFLKTLLRINLHRNTGIIPGREFFTLQYGLDGSESSGAAFEMSVANKDTTVLVNTAANVFTRIYSSKFIAYDGVLNKTDSIKCSASVDNSIDISY